MPTKICTKCGQDKELGEYYKQKDGRYGRSARCRRCIQEHQAKYRAANKEKIAEIGAKYRASNKEKIAESLAKYREANKKKIAEYRAQYHRRRRQSDPSFALNQRTRNLVRHTLKGKIQGTTRHLPYTRQQLYDHLLSTLPEGYTEADICDGSKLHIDHIRPVSSFNLTGEIDDEFHKCWALSNLQLLPAIENIRKGASIDHLNTYQMELQL